MECSICVEKYNNVRKQVECPSCKENCCSACFKTYILNCNELTPICMFCEKKLTHMFVRENTSIKWGNTDYITKRSEILLQQQKNMLPETQKYAMVELDKRKRAEKSIEISNQINELYVKISQLNNERYKLYRESLEIKEETITRRKCYNSDCKGFLNKEWFCGLCEKNTCQYCGEGKFEDHVCNEDIKMSFKLINSDSRPCPKCGIMIYKIVGCNQMFCTQCHCMFDYRSGREEKGLFHNPHYYDAIADGTLNVNENTNRCGEIWIHSLVAKLKRFIIVNNIDKSIEDKFLGFNDLLILTYHIQDITIQRYLNTEDDEFKYMRVKYILNETTDEEFLKMIASKEKKREKNEEITYILELFRDVSRDILFNVYDVLKKLKDNNNYRIYNVVINNKTIDPVEFFETCLYEVNSITKFCNQKFKSISKQFKNVAPYIDENWKTLKCKHI